MRAMHKVLVCLVALILAVPLLAPAQQTGSPKPFKPEELEQIVAPVALYPDPLLAQILMASTYPLEVAQAARFAKANAQLKGDQLNEALKKQTWDDSVKSLVSFPQVLTMMDEKLDWTQKLGDAVLAQQKELMDAVQRLRAKAHAAGNLKTTAEQKVTVVPAAAPPAAPPPAPQTVVVQQPPTVIKIETVNPQVVYVPVYNPTVVYGTWPYPAYPPYPPYYPPGYVAGTAALSFGVGMAVGAAVWGDCDWNHGNTSVNINNYNSYTKNVNTANVANQRIQNYPAGSTPGQGGNQGTWQHNPANRGPVPYRDQATQQRFGKAADQSRAQSREAFRGRAEAGRQDLARGDAGPGRGEGPGPGGPGAQKGPGDRPESGLGERGGPGQAEALGRGEGRGAGAFEGIGSGGEARSSSAQGQASRESMGGGARGASGARGGSRR
ncbi:MAG TPA: DUF3300 domain-containing protein [Methylomirabilota bacterium]|nr:DUF3300 domain-containing protein [Methylomirabilota bacterium]